MPPHTPKITAIIGATCTGKSDLALRLAGQGDAYIFSLDSLSIYRHIDIASAKPSRAQLDSVRHFAVDILEPDESVNAGVFMRLFEEAASVAGQDNKNLVIVGGSSFYLKAIVQGLSPATFISQDSINQDYINRKNHEIFTRSLKEQHEFLAKIDSVTASKIAKNDKYRISKALEIFTSTGQTPSEYFKAHPPTPTAHSIQIFHLVMDKERLVKRIAKRTRAMLERGLVEEAKWLLEKYGEHIQPFKAIGLKETLLYLKGEIDLATLETLITTHTRQLAKRQVTFNKTQFKGLGVVDVEAGGFAL